MRYLLAGVMIALVWGIVSCKREVQENVVFPYEFSGIKFNKNEITFGKVFMGEVVCDTLVLYNPLDETVECRFRASEHFTEVVPEKEYMEPGDTVRVIVRLSTDRGGKFGRIRDYVRFLPETMEQRWSHPLILTAEVVENFMTLTEEEKRQAPKVVLDTQEYDFGTIQRGDTVSHVFRLRNEGKSNLLIRRIETTCGCTAVVPDTRVVVAGDSCNVVVTFQTKGREGKQLKTIQITTNDYRQPNTILKIRANVIQDKE